MRIYREQWKDVPGYEGYYQVSSIGRVRSYPNNRGKGMTILNPAINKQTGYRIAVFSVAKVMKGFGVHRLVLRAFRGEPEAGQLSRHMNGVRSDNRLSNLQWGTQSQNLLDRASYGEKGGIGEDHGMAKLDEQEVVAIRQELDEGATPTEVAKKYGVTRENIYLIRDRKAWRHI